MLLKKFSCLLLVGCTLLFAAAGDISLSGTVKDNAGAGIEGVDVYLKSDTTNKVQTDAAGAFSIIIVSATTPYNISVNKPMDITGHGASLTFSVASPIAKGMVSVFSGNGRRIKDIELNNISAGTQSVSLTDISNGFYIVQITLNNNVTCRKLIAAGSEMIISEIGSNTTSRGSVSALLKQDVEDVANVDTLVAQKEGFYTTEYPLTSLTEENIDIVLAEEGGEVICNPPDLPEPSALTYENEKLPSPFTFFDGTEMTRKDEWECRRQEILAMAKKYVYGPCPPKPDSVWGTVSGGNISIHCKQGSKTADFSANISGSGEAICFRLQAGIYPGNAKNLSFNASTGKIESLYGVSGMIGNLANAWMIDRVMDVLELNPDCGHDPTKMMVSGCSGCGKGAFLAGVFSRIPLTVIVESGGGGAANFRMGEWFRHGGAPYQCRDAKPQNIDNLEESGICGPWVSSVARWVRQSPAKVKNLPYDQHLLLACIAPRYLCHVTNQHGPEEWCHLGGTCEALSAWAAKPVFKALGVPENMGFLVYTESNCPMHCSNPGSATSLANEFFKRVFQGDENAKTDVWEAHDQDLQQPKGDWEDMWVDWDMDKTLQ